MSDQEPRNFDSFGDDYHQRLDRCLKSLGGRDAVYYNRLKAGWILRLAEKHLGGATDREFLDLGCGTGLTEKAIARRFRFGVGLDSSAGMLKAASRDAPETPFVTGEAFRLPFADSAFDLVFSVTLLHHLTDGELPCMMSEVRRVLRPGGLTAHFDHNPYNFMARKVVDRCEFDQGAKMRAKRQVVALAEAEGLRVVESGYLAFMPAALKFLEPLERVLKPVPAGAQYFVAAKTPADQ
jgi:SAM-dependent methyltransferase